MISKRQIALVHVAKARLGLCDADYRAILLRDAGVASSRDLTAAGFESIMATFKRLGFTANAPDEPPRTIVGGTRPGMASDAQIALLRALWDEYKGAPQDARSLGRWLERVFKVSALRFVPYTEAQRAIGVLKTMKARKVAQERDRAHG